MITPLAAKINKIKINIKIETEDMS